MTFLPLLLSAVAAAAAPAPESKVSPTPRPPLVLKVANVGTRRIHGVYLAAPRAGSWGENLLRRSALKRDEQAEVVVQAGCGVYDVRLVADDDIEYLEDEVALCDDSSDLLIAGDGDLKATRAVAEPAAPKGKR